MHFVRHLLTVCGVSKHMTHTIRQRLTPPLSRKPMSRCHGEANVRLINRQQTMAKIRSLIIAMISTTEVGNTKCLEMHIFSWRSNVGKIYSPSNVTVVDENFATFHQYKRDCQESCTTMLSVPGAIIWVSLHLSKMASAKNWLSEMSNLFLSRPALRAVQTNSRINLMLKQGNIVETHASNVKRT